LAAIAAIAREVPDALVGAGTVLSLSHLHAAAAAGSRFAISPGATPALLAACAEASIPLLPGIATSSEIMAGLELGYSRFKFFPAAASGGIPALKNFAGPFSEVKFCPTGGIDAASAPDFLALSNVLCVGGSWMAPAKMVSAGDWDGIFQLAAAAASLKLR
jgi:2-dehydro-3-deoxyphosphogluconate aldolase / (4S)-4-hydroxy-2-oxoglutarate aldolase